MNPAGLVFVAFGLFAICAAGLDWEWFMNHRKARFLVATLGRTGARVLYAVLGIGLVVLGVLVAAGILRGTG